MLVVTGGPGVGKTALITEWVAAARRAPSRRSGPAIHAAEYAVARTRTGYPAGLLGALSAQLADTVAPYGKLLRRQSGTEQHYHITQQVERAEGPVTITGVTHHLWIGRRFRLEDYHRLIRTPVEQLHDEGRLPAGGVTVVIDGLDEVAVDRDEDSFAEALAETPPVPGLRLLVSARPATATGPLRGFPSFDLVNDEPPTSHDLADYVTIRLAPVPEPLRGRLVRRIVGYCAGHFVLARALADHLIRAYGDGAAPTELAELVELPAPTGIAPAWRALLDKVGGSEHLRDTRYLPVLRIAALARDDGLPGEVLRAAVGRYSPDPPQRIDTVLDELRDFFLRVERPDAPLRLCHASLDEYLTAPPGNSAAGEALAGQGHLAIAQVLAESTRWNGADEQVARYAQQHLCTHLVAAVAADRGTVQQLAQDLLAQPDFIEALTRRLGVARLQWELEGLAAAFGHRVRPVNELAFLLGRQIAQLRDIRSETDQGFLLRQLLHAARACGADTAADYRRGLTARSPPGLETLWATGGQELTSYVREFVHGTAPVSAVAIVDEYRFVTTSDDGDASIWDVRSGRRRRLPGDGSRIRAVAARAGRVLTGSGRGAVHVWNVATATPVPPPPAWPGPVHALAILPDGERAVSLSADGSVRVWRVRDGRELTRVDAAGPAPADRSRYRPTIMVVAAGLVLTAAADGRVVVTDLQDTSQQLELRHPGDELTAAALSTDGRCAVTGGADGAVTLWDLAARGRPHRLPDEGHSYEDPAGAGPRDRRVTALVVSSDGRFVVAGSGIGAKLWDTRRDTGELLVGETGISALALLPGDRQVVTASLDHRLRLWSVESRRLLHSFPGHRDRICSLALDASGLRLVSASYDGTARLWHVPVAAERNVLAGHRAPPTAMSATADGTGLVVADADGTIWRRNLADGQGDRPRRTGAARVTALIPAAGQLMAVGTADGTTGVWNVQRAAFEHTVEPPAARVTALVAVPGDRAVAAHADGLARLWHRRTAESLRSTSGGRGFTAAAATLLGGVPAVLLAAEDHSVGLWDVESGQWRWQRRDHTMTVTSIAVCDGDEYAVTASLDGTVRRWRVSDGSSCGLGPARHAEVTTVVTGPEMLAASGAQDGTAIVWDLGTCTTCHHLDHPPGAEAVTAVAFTSSGHVLTGAADGGVRLWDIGTMAGPRLTHPRARLMLDGQVSRLLVAPAGDRAVIATATGQLTCVELP